MLLDTRSRIRMRGMLVHVACGGVGSGAKVQSPEDPMAQKERTYEQERHEAIPRAVEADARHPDHSTVQCALVSRGVLHVALLAHLLLLSLEANDHWWPRAEGCSGNI